PTIVIYTLSLHDALPIWENVLSYLCKKSQDVFRPKLQAAYEQPSYSKARSRLFAIRRELQVLNICAARSLEEGLEETLTLHRLGDRKSTRLNSSHLVISY